MLSLSSSLLAFTIVVVPFVTEATALIMGTRSGIFSALVFVVTAYLHIPTYNGYVHCGDGLIFIAACILPMPYSIIVGALGALLADLLTGFAIWAPGSMIIKGLLALLFTCKSNKILTKRSLVMLLPAALISAVGYYLYDSVSFISA